MLMRLSSMLVSLACNEYYARHNLIVVFFPLFFVFNFFLVVKSFSDPLIFTSVLELTGPIKDVYVYPVQLDTLLFKEEVSNLY